MLYRKSDRSQQQEEEEEEDPRPLMCTPSDHSLSASGNTDGPQQSWPLTPLIRAEDTAERRQKNEIDMIFLLLFMSHIITETPVSETVEMSSRS